MPEKSAGSLYAALEERFGEGPGEWQWLFKPKGPGDPEPRESRELIDTEVARLATRDRPYDNPTAGEPGKPESAFVREGARIPALHDWDILDVFRRQECLDRLPCFLRAGEQKSYRLDPAHLKVGILIAGGIAAGLNMVVDSVVKRHFSLATQRSGGEPTGLRIFGYDGGYKGLRDGKKCLLAPTAGAGRRAGYLEEYKELEVRPTDHLARAEGSRILKAGRAAEVREEEAIRAEASRDARRILDDGLDVLYVIGGNGTLSWAGKVWEALEEKHTEAGKRVVMVGGPKSMDFDVFWTDATFGFRTAVDHATDFVLAVHADASSQDRIGLLEVFGASTGWVGLHACYDSGEGDEVLIRERLPKEPEEYERFLEEVFAHLEKRLKDNGHAVLVVAEGAHPEYKWRDHGAKDAAFAKLLGRIKGRFAEYGISDVRSRYLVRSTLPNTYDIELCKVTGKLMAETALAGYTGCTVNRWQNDYVLVPFATATERVKEVPRWDYFLQTFLDRRRVEKAKGGPPDARP